MTTHARPSLGRRLFYMIPLLGWTARDVNEKGEDNIVWGLVNVFLIWGCSALLFGYPGIIVPALLLVPVILFYLILASWG